MSDTPAPTQGPTDRMEAITSTISAELSERAAKVSRMEALRDRAMQVQVVYAKIMQEVADIETATKAEMGA